MQYKEYDYIIVGQGVAGSLISHYLMKAGKKVLVVDNGHKTASSVVAAGLVNPITGRRFVKSWMVDELIPHARTCYAELETLLGVEIFESKPVAMLFNSVKMENDWLVRSSEQDVEGYVDKRPFELPAYQTIFEGVSGGVHFGQSGRVKLRVFVEHYRQYLIEQNAYLQTDFDYDDLTLLEQGAVYKDIKAERVIFAEGYKAIENPYFKYLPYWPAKGVVLHVRIPNYPFKERLVKYGVFVVHLHDDVYWVGSTYDKQYTSEEASEKEVSDLLTRLEELIKVPVELVSSTAAVRPTVRDRRPFIGQHPEQTQLYSFNGMGAKGGYLAPYWAAHFADYLEDGKELSRWVNIERYFRRNYPHGGR